MKMRIGHFGKFPQTAPVPGPIVNGEQTFFTPDVEFFPMGDDCGGPIVLPDERIKKLEEKVALLESRLDSLMRRAVLKGGDA